MFHGGTLCEEYFEEEELAIRPDGESTNTKLAFKF